MNKKIISLVLALVMVLGTFTSVFAETAKGATAKKEEVKKTETKKAEAGEKVEKVVGKDNKIQYVIDKKLVEGYEDGTYGLDKNIKRSEITRLLVLANGNEELSKQLQGSMKIYSDVDAKHWANGVITVGTTVPSDANGIAMLAGYPDGSFKPENNVTYAELAKMLVVLTKEDLTADMVKNAIWASSWMTWATQLGILNDVNVTDSNKAANRADAFTMVYNALYRMKEFKRVPANETRGIVSNLTSGKLTLNQDDKKVYDITNATVIVEGNNVRSNFVPVHSVKNLDLYKGSLVRILINDKNEVTHIIELGNPAVLARSNKAGLVDTNNNIWKDVADATVRTDVYNKIESLKDLDQKKVDGAYATVTLNGSKTKAENITFRNLGKDVKNVDLKINDKTEIYVANPYNNIMRQVKDINEALSLIGFFNYGKDYKIPNVYAGFDTTDHKSSIKGFDSEKNTAKVIVFNVVSKDNDGDKFRVINSSSSRFSTTLENTDGKLFDRDNVLNEVHFPLSYGDLLDVIEIRGDVIKTLLDHSDKKAYPVVRVLEVFDNDEVRVEDRFENETLLNFGDADIFNAKQYKELAKGDYLQFATTKNSRTVDIVSILEDTKDTRDLFNNSGSVLNVVKGIEGKTVNGIVVAVKDTTVEIDVKYTNWDSGYGAGVRTFALDSADKAKLAKGDDVTFKVNTNKYDNWDYAYNFHVNKEGQPRLDEETLRVAFADAVNAKKGDVKKVDGVVDFNYNADEKTATVKILGDTKKVTDIKNTGAMVALKDLVDKHNLVAYQIEGLDKRDITGKETTDLAQIVSFDLGVALNSKNDPNFKLGDAKGKVVKVTVYLEKGNEKATDVYTVEVK